MGKQCRADQFHLISPCRRCISHNKLKRNRKKKESGRLAGRQAGHSQNPIRRQKQSKNKHKCKSTRPGHLWFMIIILILRSETAHTAYEQPKPEWGAHSAYEQSTGRGGKKVELGQISIKVLQSQQFCGKGN